MSISRKTSRPASPHWPRHALGRACLLALAGFGTVAWAQTSPEAALSVTNATLQPAETETTGAVWSADYGLVIGESQFGSGMLDASNVGVLFGSDLSGGGVSPITVSNNTLQSLAFGNQRSSSTGLSLLTSSLLSMNLQSLSGLIQSAEGETPASMGSLSVSATVSGSSAFINQDGMASADSALSNNTLAARTQLNVADLRVEGAVPAGFASTAQGSSEVTLGATGVFIGTTGASPDAGTTGTVNLSNLQSTFSASPSATVDTAGVRLTVSGTTPIEEGVSVFRDDASVSGNTLSASTGINTATSLFTADATSAAWTGSVSVTNLQNAAAIDTTLDSLASVSGSAVTADLRFGGTDGQTDLTGSLTLNDNQISASSTGNSAGSRTASGAISAGNAITFEGGADITGSASGTGTTVSLGATSTAASAADLTLVNAQANAASSFVTSVSQGLSPSDSSGVISTIDNLAGGTLTQSGNAITASSTANLAGNLVSAGQAASVANFTGSVAALNVQSNTTLTSTASVEDSAVAAVVGITGAKPTGTVTLSNNTLAATAEGNLGVTTVALKAANLSVTGALGAGVTQGVALNPATGTASAGLGVVALSVQSNEGGALTANNEGTFVSLDFNEQDADPVVVAIDGINATLADNQLNSAATANSASTSATLEGTNGTGLSAAVGNSQRNLDMTVSANAGTISPLAVSLTSGAVTGSTLTLTGNDLNAAATGNSAANRLNVSLETASGSALLTAAPQAASTSTTSAAADLALANSQLNDNTDLTAAVAGAVSMDLGAVGSVASPSAITLSANQIGAAAEVNRASNAMVLDVGQLTGMNAALASRQVTSDSAVDASTIGNVTLVASDVTSSALTMSGNTVKSTSLGNVATNQVSLAGTNATGSSAAVSTASSATAGTSASAVADVALANLQDSSNITLSATTVGSAGITVGAVGPQTGANSALTLSDNTISALAQSNSASNTLALASTNLNGMSAGVASSQRTVGTVEATVSAADPVVSTSAAFLIDAASATSTPVVLSNNTFSAVAGMNEAFNTLTAEGAVLLGRGSTTDPTLDVASTTGVDFSVVNAQSGEGAVSALADPGTIGFTGALTGGSLSIAGNTVLARASVNTASNQLTLAATNRLEATAAVNNVQNMDSVVSATVVESTIEPSLLGANLDAVGGASTVSVSDNRVTAQATGNIASNALNATAVSGISSSGSSVQPTFAVLNSQTTQATGSIDAVLNGTTLGATLNGTGGSTSVQGNQMVALAYGNSVDNVIGMSALPGGLNTASAAITSVQYNMASISATVSGVSMVGSGTVSGTGAVNVSGNTVTAQVVGNRSVSSIAAR